MQFLESAEDPDVEPRQFGQEGPLSLAQWSICDQTTSDITQVVPTRTGPEESCCGHPSSFTNRMHGC